MRILSLFAISLFIWSCKKQNTIIINDNIETFSQFPKEEKIKLKNLVEFKFGNPKKMISLDSSSLTIANNVSGQEYHLYNYSFHNHNFSKPYLAKGRGPGEMLSMRNMGFYDNYLWLNDFSGQKMILINKRKAFSVNSSSDYIEYSFRNRFYGINFTDNLKCIATGSETSKFKIQLIDLPTGKIMDEFGELNHYPKDLPLHIITKASLTESLLKPTKDKLVLAYKLTDVVEIFNLNSKKSISIQGSEKFDLDFMVRNNQWFENDKTRVAFIGGATTNKNIYLLYSGKKFNDEKAFNGKYIYVYDWNLNPIKKIVLDKEVSQICISEDGKTIYSFNEETGYIVYATIN